MASSAINLCVLSFVLVLFTSASQIQARESQFFSKVVAHYGATSDTSDVAPTTSEEVPAPSYPPAPAPAPESEIEDGYGLYGRGSEEASTAIGENGFVPEELTDANYKEFEEKSYSSNNYNNNNEFSGNYYTNNNNGFSTEYKYNPDSFSSEQQGMSDTRFLENGKYSYSTNRYSPTSNNGGEKQGMSDTRFLENGKYSYSTNRYSPTSNNNGGYSEEKQGMSDTRFLENGKYFYDVKNDNYYLNGYNTERGSSGHEDGYYGRRENSNEFNSMEEYQQEQEENVP